MGAKDHRRSELSDEELEEQRAGELPDREALSVLDVNIAIPVDPAIAADVLSGEDPPEAEPEPEETEEPDA